MKRIVILFVLIFVFGLMMQPNTTQAGLQIVSTSTPIPTEPVPKKLAFRWEINFDVVEGELVAEETVALLYEMTDDTYRPIPSVYSSMDPYPIAPSDPLEATYTLWCEPPHNVWPVSEDTLRFEDGYIICHDIDLELAFSDLMSEFGGIEGLPDNLARLSTPGCIESQNPSAQGCHYRAQGLHIEADIKLDSDAVFPIYSYKHIRFGEQDHGASGDFFWEIDGANYTATHTYPTFGLFIDYGGAFLTKWHIAEASQFCPIYILLCGSEVKIRMDGTDVGMANGYEHYDYPVAPDMIIIGSHHDPVTGLGARAFGEFRGGKIDPTAVCGGCGM